MKRIIYVILLALVSGYYKNPDIFVVGTLSYIMIFELSKKSMEVDKKCQKS